MSVVPRLGNPTVEQRNYCKRWSEFEEDQLELPEMKNLMLGIKHSMGVVNGRLVTGKESVSQSEARTVILLI